MTDEEEFEDYVPEYVLIKVITPVEYDEGEG